MYRTGFFGTFALGNKTSGARFDYSYNYISISGSNVNSIIQTLSGSDFSNILISSNSRLANQNTPLNLSLVIYNGYDISVNALSSSIVGISNNILTAARTFNTSNNINYNYNIIPLSSYLFGGTIGLSFELYKTGFFGTIVLTNNLGATIDYSYNYVTLGGSTIYVPLTSISTNSSNSRTISMEVRLRDVTSQIAMNIRTDSSVADSTYNISGGTINSFVINSISPYKYYNFNILPNVNNLVNGTLNFNVLPQPTTFAIMPAGGGAIITSYRTGIYVQTRPLFTGSGTFVFKRNGVVRTGAVPTGSDIYLDDQLTTQGNFNSLTSGQLYVFNFQFAGTWEITLTANNGGIITTAVVIFTAFDP
jgi:hypothetical protein